MIKEIRKRLPAITPIITYIGVSWAVLQVADIIIANSKLPQWIFDAVLLVLLVGFPLVCFITTLKTFYPLYIDAQINEFASASKKIYLSVHSLNPASKNKKYASFNEALKKANERGVNVKILAPGGIERAQGAYLIHDQYGLNIKFVDQLEDEDLRYTIVDDNIIIISYQKIPSKKLSRKYAIIKSERLCKLLTGYFDEMWASKSALDYSEYIKNILQSLKITKESASLKRCSDRLGIPIHILERIM